MAERRKVAILGFSKSSRHLAPFDDPSWSIYGVNDTWAIAPRMDVILDLHAPWIYEWEVRRRRGHLAFLQSFGGPVYLIEPRADIPTSQAYPLAEVIRAIGRPYLTSSISMAIGLALLEGAEAIGLWGVELETASEYERQRPCVEYLLGLAAGRGVEIVLPDGCNLLSGAVYGRGDLNPGGERMARAQFMDRLGSLARREREIVAELESLRERAQTLEGAVNEARYYLSTLSDPRQIAAVQARIARLEGWREPLGAEIDEAAEGLTMIRGHLAEARFWANQTPEGAAQDAVLALVSGEMAAASAPAGGLVIEEEEADG